MTYDHDLSMYDEMDTGIAINELKEIVIKISVYQSLCDRRDAEYEPLNRLQRDMYNKMFELIKKRVREQKKYNYDSR